MGIKTYKPKTSSLRYKTTLSFDDLSKGNDPLKSLTKGKKLKSGRDSSGRISIRRRGGGHKRKYRLIDFNRRDKFSIPARVASIEYDPNRSANIALLVYKDGEKGILFLLKGLRLEMFWKVVQMPQLKLAMPYPLKTFLLEGLFTISSLM